MEYENVGNFYLPTNIDQHMDSRAWKDIQITILRPSLFKVKIYKQS